MQGDTVTSTVEVDVHPLTSVPITEYTLVAVGVNETPSVTPLIQIYDEAPEPDNVTALPTQTLDAVALAKTTGKLFTVTETTAELEHVPAVPITVYELVDGGINETPSEIPPVHI